MWGKAKLVLLACLVGGCATQAPPGQSGAAAAVGTPFLIAFKIPVCAVTVALAAPLAGATGLAPSEQSQRIRADLDAGLVQNCGPPYVLPVQ